MKTKTQMIQLSHSVWDNPYQGSDKKVLFVCSAGILRSATAARIYAKKFNTRSAGTEEYALIPLTHELILWADEIVFVNPENYWKAQTAFPAIRMDSDLGHKVKVLQIPDDFNHMHPTLIQEFISQYGDIE